jgi:protein SCO1/2
LPALGQLFTRLRDRSGVDFSEYKEASVARRLERRIQATSTDTGGRVWIVDFVYTRCQTVCSALGSIYQQLQQRILDGDLKGRVGLLSISFDPGRDDAAALRGYAARMRMDVDVWRIVTLTSAADRRRLLDAFGIMVVPAPLGEFEHNAALHIVDGQGQLVHIVDYDSPAQALALARVLAP